MINKDNLDYMGSDFQYKVVKALIENPKLLKSIYKILDQNCFTDPVLRKIVGTLKERFKATKVQPTYNEIDFALRSKEKDENELEYVEETIDKLKRTSSEEELFTIEYITDYFKWKYAIMFMNKTAEKLKEGFDRTVLNKYIKDISVLLNSEEEGTELQFNKETLMRALTAGEEDFVPTGIPEIDKRIANGLGKQEIGLFTALTGFGKTTFGTIIAHNAAEAGYNVLHIYFEDLPLDMMRKYVAKLDGNRKINRLRGMTDSYAEEEVERITSNEQWNCFDNLRSIRMPIKQTTVEDIEGKIDELATENFRPELLVIDYFSCLKFSRNAYKDEIRAQADCMRKIKEMAVQYNMAVWVLQQNNRPSPEKTAGMGNWQGAYEATQPASVWIELQRSAQQKENGRADLIFNKTRKSQPKDNLLDIVFDNGRMLIDCSDQVQDNEDLTYKD